MIPPELFAQRIAELKAIVADIKRRTPSVPPTMPTVDRKRRDFMQLMPRHLLWVEDAALMIDYDRSTLRDWFLDNYAKLFPPLRWRKADRDVPADELRRYFMVQELMDLIDMRRVEIGDRERRAADLRWDKIPKSQRASLLPPGF
jgi:hypothetical protein